MIQEIEGGVHLIDFLLRGPDFFLVEARVLRLKNACQVQMIIKKRQTEKLKPWLPRIAYIDFREDGITCEGARQRSPTIETQEVRPLRGERLCLCD